MESDENDSDSESSLVDSSVDELSDSDPGSTRMSDHESDENISEPESDDYAATEHESDEVISSSIDDYSSQSDENGSISDDVITSLSIVSSIISYQDSYEELSSEPDQHSDEDSSSISELESDDDFSSS